MTNAEARCNNSLRPRKPEGSLGRTAQDGHLDSYTAPELCLRLDSNDFGFIRAGVSNGGGYERNARYTELSVTSLLPCEHQQRERALAETRGVGAGSGWRKAS